MTTRHLYAGVTIRAIGDEAEITITTPARDLMKDTIDPLGMDVTGYLTGTRAVNFAHDHGRLPVAKTVSLAKSARGIRARFRWLEANPEAATVRAVFEEGVLGSSVEFVPGETARNADGGSHYLTSTLTGWALTSNPANPECVRMVKSLGLGRGDDAIDLDAIPADAEIDLATLSRADVLAALREAITEQATAAVFARQFARVPGGAEVLDLDDDVRLDPADVKAALRTALPAMVRAEVNRVVPAAIRAARGRVD